MRPYVPTWEEDYSQPETLKLWNNTFPRNETKFKMTYQDLIIPIMIYIHNSDTRDTIVQRGVRQDRLLGEPVVSAEVREQHDLFHHACYHQTHHTSHFEQFDGRDGSLPVVHGIPETFHRVGDVDVHVTVHCSVNQVPLPGDGFKEHSRGISILNFATCREIFV